jgi:hypothetical protein
MHPFLLNEVMLADLARERERHIVQLRRVREASVQAVPREPVTLRLSRESDDAALQRLAQLETRRATPGSHVVADVDGVIIAALPLNGGKPYLDPFRRSAHLVPLLELRAQQITGGIKVRRPRRRLLGALRWS